MNSIKEKSSRITLNSQHYLSTFSKICLKNVVAKTFFINLSSLLAITFAFLITVAMKGCNTKLKLSVDNKYNNTLSHLSPRVVSVGSAREDGREGRRERGCNFKSILGLGTYTGNMHLKNEN